MNQETPKLKIGVVAGEHSGDILGYNLIKEIVKGNNFELFGVGGPKIESLGLSSLFDFKELQLMGIIDPILNLKKLMTNRNNLISLFNDKEIDFFIGIDSPDFNIGIHKALKPIKTCKNIQLVSPSVWGWRQGRIKKIEKFIDHTVCLFNFEHDFYRDRGLSSSHLGHPFSEIVIGNKEDIIKKYSLDADRSFISVLPGSRNSEILNMMPTYRDFMELHYKANNNVFFLIPTADESSMLDIKKHLKNTKAPFLICQGATQDFLSISETSIITSGTASLEAAVLDASPIICYKTNFINYAIISRMLKVDCIGLPNLLLSKPAYPELIQSKCTAKEINYHMMESHNKVSFSNEIKATLKGDGFDSVAQEILSLS